MHIKLSFLLLALVLAVTNSGCGISIRKLASKLTPCTTDAVSGFQGGSGTLSDPYKICSGAQLNLVRNHLTSHFLQTRNIDLSAAANSESANWFLPIDTIDRSDLTNLFTTQIANVFSGTYDGGNYTISNFTYSPTTNQTRALVGLFGATTGTSSISNLTLNNCNISGGLLVGCLAGFNYSTLSKITINDSAINESLITNPADINLPADSISMGAGLVAAVSFYTDSSITVSNITVSNSTINLPNFNMVGGIFGQIAEGDPASSNTVYTNLNAENLNLTASGILGGVAGFVGGDLYNVEISKVNVDHVTATGTGINTLTPFPSFGGTTVAGAFAGLLTGASEIKVNDSTIRGNSIAGGAIGILLFDNNDAATILKKVLVTNTNVIADEGSFNAPDTSAMAGGAIGLLNADTNWAGAIKVGVRGGSVHINSTATTDIPLAGGVVGNHFGGDLSYSYAYNVEVSGDYGAIGGFAGGTDTTSRDPSYSTSNYAAAASVTSDHGITGGYAGYFDGANTNKFYSLTGIADANSTILSSANMSDQGGNFMPGITDLIGTIWKWSTAVSPYPILVWETGEEPKLEASEFYGTWISDCIVNGANSAVITNVYSAPNQVTSQMDQWGNATCAGAPDTVNAPMVGTSTLGDAVGDAFEVVADFPAVPYVAYSILKKTSATTYFVGQGGIVDDGSTYGKRHRTLSPAVYTKQ